MSAEAKQKRLIEHGSLLRRMQDISDERAAKDFPEGLAEGMPSYAGSLVGKPKAQAIYNPPDEGYVSPDEITGSQYGFPSADYDKMSNIPQTPENAARDAKTEARRKAFEAMQSRPPSDQ